MIPLQFRTDVIGINQVKRYSYSLKESLMSTAGRTISQLDRPFKGFFKLFLVVFGEFRSHRISASDDAFFKVIDLRVPNL